MQTSFKEISKYTEYTKLLKPLYQTWSTAFIVALALGGSTLVSAQELLMSVYYGGATATSWLSMAAAFTAIVTFGLFSILIFFAAGKYMTLLGSKDKSYYPKSAAMVYGLFAVMAIFMYVYHSFLASKPYLSDGFPVFMYVGFIIGVDFLIYVWLLIAAVLLICDIRDAVAYISSPKGIENFNKFADNVGWRFKIVLAGTIFMTPLVFVSLNPVFGATGPFLAMCASAVFISALGLKQEAKDIRNVVRSWLRLFFAIIKIIKFRR